MTSVMCVQVLGYRWAREAQVPLKTGPLVTSSKLGVYSRSCVAPGVRVPQVPHSEEL